MVNEMTAEPKEGLEKYRELIEQYAKEQGLKIEEGSEGNLRLGKAIELRAGSIGGLGEVNYISLYICDESFTDSAEEALVRPMVKNGATVIINPVWLNRQK